MCSVIGPSGAGKSTVAVRQPLEAPDDGNMPSVSSLRADTVTPARATGVATARRHGLQSFNLFPHMPVIDNIVWPNSACQRSKDEARERTRATRRCWAVR